LSGRKRYSRRQRLRTADIAALLAAGNVIRRPGFNAVLRANALGICRLGIIVPKRVLPRAVDRSRTKRLLREWFRCYQAQLGSRDLLIRVTGKAPTVAELAQLLAEFS